MTVRAARYGGEIAGGAGGRFERDAMCYICKSAIQLRMLPDGSFICYNGKHTRFVRGWQGHSLLRDRMGR